MAARNATKAGKATQQDTTEKKAPTKPVDEQQPQGQAPTDEKTTAPDQQGEAPSDELTADYVEAAGFALSEAGDVVGPNGQALPPVMLGEGNAAMVLQALVAACAPAVAPVALAGTVVPDLAATVVLDAGELIGSPALADVLAERMRQIAKGYTVEHDKQHRPEALVKAGISYAMLGADLPRPLYFWPFAEMPNRQHQPREQLVRAAAMLLAAIDALDAAEVQG